MYISGFLCFSGLNRLSIQITAIPNTFSTLLTQQLIKDPIASNNDKIMVLCDLKALNIRFSDNHIRIASPEIKLSFRISKRSAYLKALKN